MKTIVQRINDLANHLSENDQNRDLTFDIICQLRQFDEDASKSEYTKQELEALILVKNDCLTAEAAKNLPAQMVTEIRNLQQEIIDTYGFQD